MSIFFKIPKSAHYLTTTNIFTGTFNVPTLGKYNFQVAGNTGQSVYPLQNNKILLIERMSIGGDISEENYLSAIESLPAFRLRKKKTNEAVYIRDIPVVNYVDNQDVTAFVDSTKQGARTAVNAPSSPHAVIANFDDELIIDFYGILIQTAPLVGKASIKIHISLSMYLIASTIYYKYYRDELEQTTGKSLNN